MCALHSRPPTLPFVFRRGPSVHLSTLVRQPPLLGCRGHGELLFQLYNIAATLPFVLWRGPPVYISTPISPPNPLEVLGRVRCCANSVTNCQSCLSGARGSVRSCANSTPVSQTSPFPARAGRHAACAVGSFSSRVCAFVRCIKQQPEVDVGLRPVMGASRRGPKGDNLPHPTVL